jgi:hypothetical protein
MLWDMFVRGGPVMWPLLTASVFAVALVLERTLAFLFWYQRFDPVVERLRPLFLHGDWQTAERWCRRRGPFTRLALAYIQNRHRRSRGWRWRTSRIVIGPRMPGTSSSNARGR